MTGINCDCGTFYQESDCYMDKNLTEKCPNCHTANGGDFDQEKLFTHKRFVQLKQ